MSVREAKPKKGGKPAVEAADLPENYYPTPADALRDLARFLEGQSAQPDAALQMEDIMQGINAVLNDDLLVSVEETLERALFQDVPEDDTAFTMRLLPTHELLKKLRDLQKTRLRDAIERAMRMSHS